MISLLNQDTWGYRKKKLYHTSAILEWRIPIVIALGDKYDADQEDSYTNTFYQVIFPFFFLSFFLILQVFMNHVFFYY